MVSINLNFDWKYSEKFEEQMLDNNFDDKEFEIVHIPHANKIIPYNNFDEEIYQFVSCYRKNIFIEKTLQGKAICLIFEGVANAATVYVNGQLAFEHKGGYTAFGGDIAQFVQFGADNIITVKVDSTERDDIPPFGGVVDYLCYGGIYREVYINVFDGVYANTMHITPLDVLDKPKAQVDINFSQNVDNMPIDIKVLDMQNNVIATSQETANGDNFSTVLEIADAKLWDIDNPFLYTVVATFGKESVSERFGLRECRFKKKGFFLNGKRIKIRGLNRHQSYPYVGYAMPKSAQESDAEFLKDTLGLNLVRTSHYPNSKHFMNKCDEIGLMVFTEIPGWQFISKKQEWRDVCLQHTQEMISQYYNHPSIILWGVRINESGDDKELYTQTNKIAHSMDKTRQTGGVRCFPMSKLLEDVYTYNDFSYAGKKTILMPKSFVAGNVPYLITEFNGHMFPTKTFDHEKRRQEHALRYAKVINQAYKKKGISGCIGWCMSDYNTHKDFGSGDKICYHGISDMFRIEKLAASVYKMQQTKNPVLEISSNMEIGDNDGGQVGTIYMFTNCDQVKLYKNGKLVNEFDMAQERKKSEFKFLPFPPVEMLDIIGNQLEYDDKYKFSKRDAKKMKNVLLTIKKSGTIVGIIKKLFSIAGLIIKYRLSIDSVTELFGKYCSSWGQKQVSYRFEGYTNGQKVIETEKGAIYEKKLYVKSDRDSLIEDKTYDVVRVVIKATNQFDNVCPYDNSVVRVKTNGIVDIIGDDTFALIGGQRAVWLKTNGKSGIAQVVIECDGKSQTIKLNVEKK